MFIKWLENIVPSTLRHEHIVLQVNYVFTLLFFSFILGFVIMIIFYRIKRNYKQKKMRKTETQMIRFFNNNIFDAYMPVYQIHLFKYVFLNKKLSINVAIQQFVVFAENFKGESLHILQRLFKMLYLDKYLFNVLEKGNWYEQARAVYVLSELGICNDALVRPFLISKHDELREQAIFYFIKTAEKEPLIFLEDIKTELNVWNQVYIEDSLRYFYKGPEPDFSKWLSHKFTSVVIFSIRMIQVYNQFQHIPQLMLLVENPNKDIRINSIRALRRLGHEELLEIIIKNFKYEEVSVQKEMIWAVNVLGTNKHLQQLKLFIDEKKNQEIAILLQKYCS